MPSYSLATLNPVLLRTRHLSIEVAGTAAPEAPAAMEITRAPRKRWPGAVRLGLILGLALASWSLVFLLFSSL